MPRINPFDQVVDKITNECNTSEDWGLIMEICDKVKTVANGSKDCLHSITRRLSHLDPHVVLFSLTLLDACVKNCGRNFHLEVCARSFVDILKKMLLNKKCHPKILDRLKLLIRRWAEEDFANDPQLSLMTALYSLLKQEGINFNSVAEEKNASAICKSLSTVKNKQEEEDDINKAIKLSLKETNSSPKTSKSLYPVASSQLMYQNPVKEVKEPRKVRALYDFEAAEDNELTFKIGEIVLVLDDADSNWWKGSNHRGEGLFPSNFVTADLTVEPNLISKEITTKLNDSDNDTKPVESTQNVTIDEAIIDRVLHMLHETDPTSEQSESEDALPLQEYCMAMGPLIDQELEQIDRKHASLTSSCQQLMDALNYYHALMKDCVPMTCNPCPVPPNVAYPYPQQPYCNQPYLPPNLQQVPLPNVVPQQYSHGELTMQSASGIPQSQGQFEMNRSAPFMNVHRPSLVNPVNNTYSIAPNTTANY